MSKSNQFWDLFINFENETTFGIKLVTENQMSMVSLYFYVCECKG
jgi:hypothetical protein